MSELFDKSIRTLELPAVLRMLAEQTNSAEARERALATVPQTDEEDVGHLQDETDAARDMIGLKGSPAFSGIKPVAESLYRPTTAGPSIQGSCWTLPGCCAAPGVCGTTSMTTGRRPPLTTSSAPCGATGSWRTGSSPPSWRRT